VKSRHREKQTPPLDRARARRQYDRIRPQAEAVLRRLNRRIRSLLAKAGINANCKYRLKTFDSYFEKVLRQHNRKTGRVALTDLLGMRIICPFLSDLDETERLLKEAFAVLESERKGSRHSFREFGYDSVHLLIQLGPNDLAQIVPHASRVCEVQIRTILQDAWAEVEHEIIYKGGRSLLNESIKRKLAALNATLTLSDITFQEIREYQREIQQRGDRRRETLQEKIADLDSISILESVPAPTAPPADYRPLFPVKPEGTLERLIFDALDAHGRGQFDDAIRIYSRILKMNPPDSVRAVIHNHRGMAWFVLSQYQRALRDFSRVVELDAANTRGYNNRALAYRMLGRHQKALADLDRSLELDPFQMDPYYIRALTHHTLGDSASALSACERALNLQPDFAPAVRLKTIIAVRTVK